MLRFSVDIDLAYLPVAGRAGSLAAIQAALLRIKAAIEAGIQGSHVTIATTAPENKIVKLMVSIRGPRSRSKPTRSCAEASIRRLSSASAPVSKMNSALPPCRSFHLRTCMAASWSQRWIASICRPHTERDACVLRQLRCVSFGVHSDLKHTRGFFPGSSTSGCRLACEYFSPLTGLACRRSRYRRLLIL